jgi:putative nucleotidyltransferase with HDIG domain
LGFAIATETFDAIGKNSALVANISSERIRDEFMKIIDSPSPAVGVDLLQKTGLLKHFIPELEQGIGCDQKGAHIYDVYNHLLHALQHAADKGFSREIRLTALFHDIGKPATRRYDRNKDKYTFFGHEVVGARMTKKILDRLRVPRETEDLVVTLVRNHMFFSDTEQITLSAVRRIIQKVKPEHIWELMEVRECDRVGMKKAEAPYRLRKYHAMIEEALRDPISVSALKVDGTYLMEVLHMKPGRRMGWILHALLEEVLEDPTLNTVETLTVRVKDLDELEDKDLQILGEKGKERKEEVNEEEIGKLHVKHGVKKK